MKSKNVTPDLSVNIGGIVMKNPVMTASGTSGYGEEIAEIYDLSKLGALTVKGLSIGPQEGNPPPRVCETPAGMLNAIGLQNIGVRAFIDRKLPRLRTLDVAVIANIYGHRAEDYAEVARLLTESGGVDGIELNISCPNVRKGGMAFGTDPSATKEVVGLVRGTTHLPLIVKLSPNVTDITEFARIAEGEGADVLSLINTLLGMAIDVKTRRPRLANVTGGLSGPAILPVALRMVYQVAQVVKVPVIGMGGIMNPSDAIAFLLAGASAVALGTANFVDPMAPVRIVEGIREYMRDEGFAVIADLVGAMEKDA
ncbi:MAG: dihydroorotate dehydrogenase [Deltaproteobacteria bacterium]|nr:dihydroorotate dehydrogenase [Deltaproteobacteria bacterium]